MTQRWYDFFCLSRPSALPANRRSGGCGCDHQDALPGTRLGVPHCVDTHFCF